MKHKSVGMRPFDAYAAALTDEERAQLAQYFEEFDAHCLPTKREKRLLRADAENALMYYASAGVPLAIALARLPVENLGGFYSRPPILWFPLDDAAKIYPLSMQHGRMSVFRLAVNLKSDVVPELLQMALNYTIKRFPSFATTLKKGYFWHYLDTTKRRFNSEPETDIPCQPLRVSRSGSQSFRVLYYRNRISAEFFHVLTDGTGGLTFLKALTAEYLRLTGVEAEQEGLIWRINDVPATDEFENAFKNVPLSTDTAGFMDRPAVQMNGRLSVQKPYHIIHLRMSAAALKAAAAKYGATVTAYMLGLMFLAGKAATDELQGEMSIQVPVNMRKFYPSSTVRNFSMYCGIRIDISETGDLQKIINMISPQLKEKTAQEPMRRMLTATERLVSALKYVPLAVKQPAARLVYGFLGDRIFSNTLSNLGVVEMPSGYAAEIDSMDFVLGTAITNRAGCAMITINDTATFSISKTTADPTFEEQMYRLLTEDGLEVRAEGSILYED